MINDFSVIIFGYLIGSIPFGYILTKIFLKKDIRDIGSGNIGATNALRTGNKIIGYLTLTLDIFKALIPILYIKLYNYDLILITSLSVFIGHVFPIWLKFKGGKGVATYLGILVIINPMASLLFISTWLLTYIIFKFSSLSSIIGSLMIPIYIYIFEGINNVYFFIIMFVLIFYTHRENIKRLINKEENKTKIY
tara:strand:- start:1 stop:582 length:582 start_codon:yes stop_codon:yes gene_type:complete